MRLRRTAAIILPGIESVAIDGHGAFTFLNGEADVSDEAAKILIDKGEATAIDAPVIVVAPRVPDLPDPHNA